MNNYGLSSHQIKFAESKLRRNLDFLSSNGLEIDGKFVSYDKFVANSYVNPKRYIAELQHRAWSLFDYARERKLSNIFITLTLPSKWHPKKTYKGRLIKNKSFAGRKYITTIKHPQTNKKIKILNAKANVKIPFLEPELCFKDTIDKYTPKNGSKELSKMFKRLLDHWAYKAIPRENRCYFRVFEPHKDGTPHLHISMFIPDEHIKKIENIVKRFFPAPLSKVEINVNKPVSYLMKYVLKTIDDLRDDKPITNLTLWYLYHGISRFYTSHTFVALEIYRKLNGKYDLITLTQDYNTGFLRVYQEKSTKDIVRIENDFGHLYSRKPVNLISQLNDYISYNDLIFEPLKRADDEKPLDLYLDGEHFVMFKGRCFKKKKYPKYMNDIELYNYFSDLDVESCNYQHYLYVRNLCIDRGLIKDEKTSLNESEVFAYGF